MKLLNLAGSSFGVFIGTWLTHPLILDERTFTDGFFVGLIAGGLTFIVFGGIPLMKQALRSNRPQ